ncbi:MAG: ABC transporter substrate-binding protein [Chlamydiae bacterium]|nr:ABC transporter substrate-binding protein [Chlamydiota bacterium]
MRFKISALLLAAALFMMSGCSKSSAAARKTTSQPDKINVLSTIAMIDDLVGAIGGIRVENHCLISGEIDPHSYELVKGDDEKIADAQIVFYNGLNLEHGASLSLKIQKHPKSIAVGNYVLYNHPELILKKDHIVDPHIWMDISTWLHIIQPITEALIEVDPGGITYYQERAQALRQEMIQTHEYVLNLMQAIPEEKRYLVTSHDAFGYFARSYLSTAGEIENGSWTKRFAAPEGLAPDVQLSVQDIQGIIDHLVKYKISVVFAESNVSQDSLKKIISSSKEKKHIVKFSEKVLYGDAMGSYDEPVSSYLDMIKKNALSLSKEWQK